MSQLKQMFNDQPDAGLTVFIDIWEVIVVLGAAKGDKGEIVFL